MKYNILYYYNNYAVYIVSEVYKNVGIASTYI